MPSLTVVDPTLDEYWDEDAIKEGLATAKTIKRCVGKTITAMELIEGEEGMLDGHDHLVISFDDNTKLVIWDDKQACRENRYMRTDDALADYIGSQLVDVELRDATGPIAPGIPTDPADLNHSVHDVQFLVVKTTKGEVVMSSHNDHNGYYEGFNIKAAEEVSP